jgi:hypothetical protein
VQLAEVMKTMARRRVLAWSGGIAAAMVIVVVWCVVIVSLVTRDTRQDIDLADLSHGAPGTSAMDGWADHTAALCKGVTGCVQGFTSDHTAFRKFDTREDAHAFAKTKTNTYQSNWIVIQYTDPHLTATDRRDVQDYINGLATSGG